MLINHAINNRST